MSIFARNDLATAYRLIADWKLDDHTYTHLSCRANNRTADRSSYYLAPFGQRFEEIQAEDLLEIECVTHNILSGKEKIVNSTAYYLHSPIYESDSSIGAILHLHTPEMIAVSAHPQGLLPLSQWALHFYNNTLYYDYDSLLQKEEQAQNLLNHVGNSSVIFMRHHGVTIVGKTIWETIFYAHHLQKACMTQCLILSSCANPLIIPQDIAQQTCESLLSFEENLGWRDWQAWKRYLSRKEPSAHNTHAPVEAY